MPIELPPLTIVNDHVRAPGAHQIYTNQDGNLVVLDKNAVEKILLGPHFKNHYGDYAGYDEVVAASTTPTSGYSRVVKAGSMGANGYFLYDAWFLVSNTGATSVSATFAISFGGTTLHTVGSNATGASTPRYHLVRLVGVVANRNDPAVQRAAVQFDGSTTVLQDTAALSSGRDDLAGIKTAAVNTGTGDRTFDITGTLNAATNSLLERLGVNFYGPYYQA